MIITPEEESNQAFPRYQLLNIVLMEGNGGEKELRLLDLLQDKQTRAPSAHRAWNSGSGVGGFAHLSPLVQHKPMKSEDQFFLRTSDGRILQHKPTKSRDFLSDKDLPFFTHRAVGDSTQYELLHIPQTANRLSALNISSSNSSKSMESLPQSSSLSDDRGAETRHKSASHENVQGSRLDSRTVYSTSASARSGGSIMENLVREFGLTNTSPSVEISNLSDSELSPTLSSERPPPPKYPGGLKSSSSRLGERDSQSSDGGDSSTFFSGSYNMKSKTSESSSLYESVTTTTR